MRKDMIALQSFSQGSLTAKNDNWQHTGIDIFLARIERTEQDICSNVCHFKRCT